MVCLNNILLLIKIVALIMIITCVVGVAVVDTGAMAPHIGLNIGVIKMVTHIIFN